jgi:hypothetical protein
VGIKVPFFFIEGDFRGFRLGLLSPIPKLDVLSGKSAIRAPGRLESLDLPFSGFFALAPAIP